MQGGKKKPLNMLENPIYPDIKKGPPKFVWSKKHWNVDVGATMRDTQPQTQFIENAVLAQSRDYNQNVYGRSSHRDIVNAEFRPPLTNHYEDEMSLNRLPVKLQAIIPHINPGTAGHDGGTNGYSARNQRAWDVEGSLTDRIKDVGSSRPTFYCPMDAPIDNSVLPDLETKMPPISVNAGWNFPTQMVAPEAPNDPNFEKKFSNPMISGFSTQVKLDGDTGFENFTAVDNRPTVSASSGFQSEYNSAFEVQEMNLDHNRPQTSVGSGMNTSMTIDAPVNMMELQSKNDKVLVQVLNPGSETGFRQRNNNNKNTQEFVRQNKPAYSYTVPSEFNYKDQNYLTNKPHMRKRLQVEKSYGQISQSSGIIPKSHIHPPMERKSSRKRNPLMVQKKKSVYRF